MLSISKARNKGGRPRTGATPMRFACRLRSSSPLTLSLPAKNETTAVPALSASFLRIGSDHTGISIAKRPCMTEASDNLVLALLRGLRADLADTKSDLKADLHSLRADVASDFLNIQIKAEA